MVSFSRVFGIWNSLACNIRALQLLPSFCIQMTANRSKVRMRQLNCFLQVGMNHKERYVQESHCSEQDPSLFLVNPSKAAGPLGPQEPALFSVGKRFALLGWEAKVYFPEDDQKPSEGCVKTLGCISSFLQRTLYSVYPIDLCIPFAAGISSLVQKKKGASLQSWKSLQLAHCHFL